MKKTLQEDVLSYLKRNRTVTGHDIFKMWGTHRGADVILRLRRKGHKITTTLELYKAKYRTVNIARYRLSK